MRETRQSDRRLAPGEVGGYFFLVCLLYWVPGLQMHLSSGQVGRICWNGLSFCVRVHVHVSLRQRLSLAIWAILNHISQVQLPCQVS